jgi:hypothetical protein
LVYSGRIRVYGILPRIRPDIGRSVANVRKAQNRQQQRRQRHPSRGGGSCLPTARPAAVLCGICAQLCWRGVHRQCSCPGKVRQRREWSSCTGRRQLWHVKAGVLQSVTGGVTLPQVTHVTGRSCAPLQRLKVSLCHEERRRKRQGGAFPGKFRKATKLQASATSASASEVPYAESLSTRAWRLSSELRHCSHCAAVLPQHMRFHGRPAVRFVFSPPPPCNTR